MYQDQGRKAKTDLNFSQQASRRKDQAAMLREKKRGEKLEEKRRATGGGITTELEEVGKDNRFASCSLEELARLMYSANPEEQFLGTQALRQRLAQQSEPPVAKVMALEPPVVERFVQLLQQPDPRLQFEAAWALTNITATDATEPTGEVVRCRGVPALVNLLTSPAPDVVEQSVWALGNIAGESPDFRNLVLSENVLEPLMRVLQMGQSGSLMSNATWTLSNLLRGKPQPAPQYIEQVLPLLVYLLDSPDNMVRVDALWALSFVSDGSESQIDSVQQLDGLVPKLLGLLNDPELPYNMLCPALRTTGNFLTGSNAATDRMLHAGMLPILSRLIENPKPNIQKECCWAISNINAGLEHQIQAVIQEGLLPKVVTALRQGETLVKKEAMWAVVNLLEKGAPEQLFHAVECGAIVALADYLNPQPDLKGLTVGVEGLQILINKGDDIVQNGGHPENIYRKQMLDLGVQDRVTKLREWLHQHAGRKEDLHNLEEALMMLEQSLDGNAFDTATTAGFIENAAPSGNLSL